MTETNKYNFSKVYKLYNEATGMFYFGSTCQPLHMRLYDHKKNSKKEKCKKIKLYAYFNEQTFDDFKIVLVEEFNLQNKQQLLREENKYIEEHREDPLCINTRRAYSGFDDKKEACRDYWRQHRETLLIKQKEYRNDNIEQIREYDRLRNKTEARKEQRAMRIKCICGMEMRADSRKDHEKTKGHINLLSSQKTD